MKETIKLYGFRPLVCIAVIAVIGFSMASCGGGGSPHEHDFGTAWKSDATHHWHECTADGEKSDYADHTFTDGICTVCEYDNRPTVTFNSNGGSDVAPITGITSGTTINEPTAPTKTGTIVNVFEGWYDESLTTAFSFDTPITANITLYAKWDFPYKIGDTGLGGGKIFYRSEEGFTMTDDGTTAHYLEAAPADMATTLRWSTAIESPFIDVTGTETAIGTGRKNTALVLATDSTAPAAKACNDYNNGGKDDWFLPSKDELNELYKSKDAIGMIIASSGGDESFYWSSSQVSNYFAWSQRFSDGYQDNYFYKINTFSVRAVRAF